MNETNESLLATKVIYTVDSIEMAILLNAPWYKKPFWALIVMLRSPTRSSPTSILLFSIIIPVLLTLLIIGKIRV